MEVFGASFDSADLASCKTVGDVDHLVGGDKNKPVKQRKQSLNSFKRSTVYLELSYVQPASPRSTRNPTSAQD